jgi:hypothetical protein
MITNNINITCRLMTPFDAHLTKELMGKNKVILWNNEGKIWNNLLPFF